MTPAAPIPASTATILDLARPSLLSTDPHDGSVRFDGVDDYVKVPGSRSLSPGDRVSVEAWIKPARLPGRGGFALVAGEMGSYSIQLDGRRLAFTIAQAQGRSRLRARAGLIVAGHAYHVVGTYDGTTQRLFVDGVNVVSAPLSGSIAHRTNPLRHRLRRRVRRMVQRAPSTRSPSTRGRCRRLGSGPTTVPAPDLTSTSRFPI